MTDENTTVSFIESWISEKVESAGAKGAILGLSGGIDSAVLALILRRMFSKDRMLAVIMPCESNPQDAEHAKLLAYKFDLPIKTVDLTQTFQEYQKLISGICNFSEMSKANTKARLRMTTLYAIGQSMNFLVCGTGNKAELTVGYFTKYGDSGSDMLPLGDLLKKDIRSIAEFLGIPKELINKPPSAGFWNGQTDEGEMGITYEAIDKYISTGEGTTADIQVIKAMNLRSAHKRATPPICVVPR